MVPIQRVSNMTENIAAQTADSLQAAHSYADHLCGQLLQIDRMINSGTNCSATITGLITQLSGAAITCNEIKLRLCMLASQWVDENLPGPGSQWADENLPGPGAVGRAIEQAPNHNLTA